MCLCLDYFGVVEVQEMKVRVELMVVKGPSVYLVLVNMKYNLSLSLPSLSLSQSVSLSLSGNSCVLLLWVSVVCSPLKVGFVCSHRSGSLGNLITRLKALSIRQITRSVCASPCLCECASGCVCVFSGVHSQCVCVC